MKKNIISTLLTVLFIFPFISSIDITGESVTGEVITGEASNVDFNLSIKIGGPRPELKIISPESGTLISDLVTVIYEAKNYDEIFLNIDGLSNISITDQVTFKLSEGFHTVTLYAISEYLPIHETLNLTINKTVFEIIYDSYKFSGETTKLEAISYERMQSLENLTIEKEGSGKIYFEESISLIEDINTTDNILNLDQNIEISQNKISINTSALPNFNKEATLLLNNLKFKSPIILKDGTDCPLIDCQKVSYIEGNLKFRVSGFSTYSTREGYVEPVLGGGGSGGGGGGGGGGDAASRPTTGIFEVNEKELKSESYPGATFKKIIQIENKQNQRITIITRLEELDHIISIPREITLEAKEIKEIEIEFILREDLEPEMYVGEILFISSGQTEELWVVLEVENKGGLFDTYLEILNLKIHPGDTVLAKTEMFNLGGTEKVDVEVVYSIKDSKGVAIVKKESTIAVETKIESVEELELPQDILPGKYVAYMKVLYEGKTAIASEEFEVITTVEYYLDYIGYILIIISITILLYSLIDFIRKKESPKEIIKRRNKKKKKGKPESYLYAVAKELRKKKFWK